MKHYTGVGSRETPADIVLMMNALGKKLADADWILRTGAAVGADQAFELGWIQHVAVTQDRAFTPAEIFLPWDGYEKHSRDMCFGCNILPDLDNPALYKDALVIAEQTHPNWAACKRGARSMHARNVYQVLGRDLMTPSRMLIAWTPLTRAGEPKGGTATAIRLAESYKIPCFNLNKPPDHARIQQFLEE